MSVSSGGRKYWKSGKEVGIVLDEERNLITISAGDTSIVVDGEEGVVCLSGGIREMNSGDRTEEILLQKEAGLLSVIPSTTFTPIAQARPNIPIPAITGLISELGKLYSLYK